MPVVNAPALNLVLVLVAALWLPAGPCCAIATAAVGDATSETPVDEPHDPASPAAPENCPAPAPCDSDGPTAPEDPAQPGHSGPCDSAEGCDCPPALSVQCARSGSDAPAIVISSTLPIPTGAVDAALADLYPPTFPTGRLAIDAGRPEPTGVPTLLGLGCMLTN